LVLCRRLVTGPFSSHFDFGNAGLNIVSSRYPGATVVRTDCEKMAVPRGVARYSNFNDLKLQTCVSTRIEPKRFFGAVTNWETDIPPTRNTVGWHIAPSERANDAAAPCTNASTKVGAPAGQGVVRKNGRYSSRRRASQLGSFGRAYSGAHALVRDKEVAGSNAAGPYGKECIRVIRRTQFAAMSLERNCSPASFRGYDNKQLTGAVRITLSHSTLSDLPEGSAPTGAS
jgi:hypothetical protein